MLIASFFFCAAQVVDTIAVRVEVDSLVQLNRELANQRNFEEALNIIEMAERKAVAAFGKNHALHAQYLFNHERTYYYMSKYDKAEPLYLEAKVIQEKVLGKEHLYCAKILVDLGSLYFYKGEYDKAETIYLEAKATWGEVLGKEHPNYATSLPNEPVDKPSFVEVAGDTCITLLAGQFIDAGSVCFEVSGSELCVSYNTVGGWSLEEVQLWVGTTMADRPINNSNSWYK